MLFVGRQRQRTCQTLTRRAFLQVGGSSVLGLTLADLLRLASPGRCPRIGIRQVGALALAVGRPVPPGYVGPQTGRTAGIPRSVLADRDEGSRHSHHRAVSEDRADGRPLQHYPFAAHRLQRSRRCRYHWPDGQFRRRSRSRRSTLGGHCPARDRLGGSPRARLPNRLCRRSSSWAAVCTRARRPSSAKAAAPSVPCTIPSASNTIPLRVSRYPPCNCRPI